MVGNFLADGLLLHLTGPLRLLCDATFSFFLPQTFANKKRQRWKRGKYVSPRLKDSVTSSQINTQLFSLIFQQLSLQARYVCSTCSDRNIFPEPPPPAEALSNSKPRQPAVENSLHSNAERGLEKQRAWRGRGGAAKCERDTM